MEPSLPDDPTYTVLVTLLAVVVRLGVLVPILWVVYAVVTLPWRRRERAALLLDLLQAGFDAGQTPDQTLSQIDALREPGLPKPIRKVAAFVRGGLSWNAALDLVPRALPPSTRGLLQTGLRHAAPEQVLSVCRRSLSPPPGQERGTRGAITWVVMFTVLAGIQNLGLFRLAIFPKLRQVGSDLGLATGFPPDVDLMFAASRWTLWITLGLFLILQAALFTRLRGHRWEWLFRPLDAVQLLIPWHRDRAHRDFAGMLALLLDAGVPEGEAVLRAGEATGSTTFARRAARVVRRLEDGEPLPRAIGAMDRRGEFRWRLENACHGSGVPGPTRFTETLQGWLRALDARAFQLETNAAQGFMATLIVGFGLTVGLHSAAILGWLVHITESAA